MRLKLYRAASVAEAMAQVRAELGPEALILSTRRLAQGVELTAALEPEELPGLSAPQPAEADFSSHSLPAPVAAALSGLGSVEAVARALRGIVRCSALPLAAAEGGTAPLLLAGMPGAGKTLAIARLATRLVLAGIRPTVITADGRRAGAAEELAAFTRLLGVRLMVAGTPVMLVRALAAASEQTGVPGPVLIDSSGINPFAAGEITGIAELAQAARAIPVLVMQAGLHPDDAAEQARAFAPVGARHLLPTRLDLTRRLGSIFAAAMAGDLALTEASAGPGATDRLLPITPDFLAARLLGAEAPVQAAPALRRPSFPTARAHAAHAWSEIDG